MGLLTALSTDCGAFLTNDRSLRRIKGLDVLCLADFAAGGPAS